ncbi:hypothetical protein Tco_0908309 [Tanacetum coccineum]|uniref:Uncharacterized protein n=1 Tax=Tanacetum coccineum TaxID=301880 RepID=A0ABQ5CT72_9ASTR
MQTANSKESVDSGREGLPTCYPEDDLVDPTLKMIWWISRSRVCEGGRTSRLIVGNHRSGSSAILDVGLMIVYRNVTMKHFDGASIARRCIHDVTWW